MSVGTSIVGRGSTLLAFAIALVVSGCGADGPQRAETGSTKPEAHTTAESPDGADEHATDDVKDCVDYWNSGSDHVARGQLLEQTGMLNVAVTEVKGAVWVLGDEAISSLQGSCAYAWSHDGLTRLYVDTTGDTSQSPSGPKIDYFTGSSNLASENSLGDVEWNARFQPNGDMILEDSVERDTEDTRAAMENLAELQRDHLAWLDESSECPSPHEGMDPIRVQGMACNEAKDLVGPVSEQGANEFSVDDFECIQLGEVSSVVSCRDDEKRAYLKWNP